jgi:hypothetical protein
MRLQVFVSSSSKDRTTEHGQPDDDGGEAVAVMVRKVGS